VIFILLPITNGRLKCDHISLQAGLISDYIKQLLLFAFKSWHFQRFQMTAKANVTFPLRCLFWRKKWKRQIRLSWCAKKQIFYDKKCLKRFKCFFGRRFNANLTTCWIYIFPNQFRIRLKATQIISYTFLALHVFF